MIGSCFRSMNVILLAAVIAGINAVSMISNSIAPSGLDGLGSNGQKFCSASRTYRTFLKPRGVQQVNQRPIYIERVAPYNYFKVIKESILSIRRDAEMKKSYTAAAGILYARGFGNKRR